MKFQFLIKGKMMNIFSYIKTLNVVFILQINVKHFNIYKQEKFHEKFITSGPDLGPNCLVEDTRR